MTAPVSVHDAARRAIIRAASAIHEASMAAAWACTNPQQSASIAEATEYAMAALKGMQRVLTDTESVE